MSCSGSTYCFTNTGNNLINDTYISGGTHNSNLYYTGVTNNLFIYYSTTNNEWCLSTALDGSCLMSGDSPGPSQGCPDFSNFYFSEGLCPTPTPTPTSAVDCSDLDFEALFDCDVTPEPSPTSTPTPTPTPTITPTSTDLCGGVDIIATIESITPTPSPTPTITPTTSSPVVRPCTFSGDVTFNVIDGDIVCPYSFEFQDCYNGATYLTTSQVSSPSGGELEDFDIFNADVNGERRCISFIKINLLEIGGDVINLISGPIGKSNEGDCIYCGPSPSVTPTSTVTPTPTPTPTLPILGIQLEECCNGISFVLENYFGTNLNLGDTYYYPFTGGTDICATVVPYSGLGQSYNYSGIGGPVLMQQGCDDLECPSCGDESYYVYRRCDDIKYWLVQSVMGDTITPGDVQRDDSGVCWEFQYISSGYPNLNPSLNVTNYTGNYFNNQTVYPDCDSCLPLVSCIESLTFVVEYNHLSGVTNNNPCTVYPNGTRGHTCNQAVFNINANGVLLGQVNLNNIGGSYDNQNFPPNYPNYVGSSPYDRYDSITLTSQQAQNIASNSTNGLIDFTFDCGCIQNVNCTNSSCHTGVGWVRLIRDLGLPSEEVLYSGCAVGNILNGFDPCQTILP